jgi:hypothetical protein
MLAQLCLTIEASEEEILKALKRYVEKAEEGGLYSTITIPPGPNGEGIAASFSREPKNQTLAEIRAKLGERSEP